MAEKRYLIATACNKKYEDFLLNHWFRSLKENVNLSETDVLVMDYGLSEDIVQKLSEQGVIVRKAMEIDGHINNMRFFELRNFLIENQQYEQVILCDSGDIIFQDDISYLFKQNTNEIRAVPEDISPNMDIVIKEENVENPKEMKDTLWKKDLINAGFVIYPRDVFVDFVNMMENMIKDRSTWGVDMILLNYYAYKKGFYALPGSYNFIPTTSKLKYVVKDGVFYLVERRKKTKIHIVHNAGSHRIFRPILNFGYGKDHNIPRPIMIFILRAFYIMLTGLRGFGSFLVSGKCNK